MLSIDWIGCAARIAVVLERAYSCSDNGIEVAIRIEIRQSWVAERPHINTIEGVVAARLLCIAWVGGATRVAVVFERAVQCSDNGILVAIAIDVSKGGGRRKPDIKAIEGVSCASDGNKEKRLWWRVVLEIIERAGKFPNNSI
ncbi:MAG: hypothetical protein RMX97_00325 [Nostoc sp. DedQUE11]|nr:hypothetical protein [Nostoc sp. DedQUE11]